MKTAKELTEIAQDARELKLKRLREEAENICEKIGEEMLREAEAGKNTYTVKLPANIYWCACEIFMNNGYEVNYSRKTGEATISWSMV
jgi:hypothetical protein